MVVKTITYTDYNGVERTEDFAFNLNKSELIMWLSTDNEYTLDKVLERLYQERNMKRIMETFEDLLHRSYGKKSLDGRKFEKSEEIWQDFYQTEAYSKIFTELIADGKKSGEFVSKVIPKELVEEIVKTIMENKEGIPDAAKDYLSIFTG